MPLYELNLKDGTTLDVEAPAGATEAQIISLANQQYTPQALDRARRMAELRAAQPSYDFEQLEDDEGFLDDITPDFLEEFLKGTASGVAGILESGALGAATVLPEREELAVRDGIKSLFDPVQEALSIDRDTGGFAAGTRKFGEGLGSFGGILASAAINPALAVGLATTAGAGEASERARAGGATEEERAKASLLGFGVGATELISPLRILSVFKKGLGQDATVGLVGSLKRIAQEGGVEAAQEASAGIMQNLIEQGIYNPEQGTFEGAGEQALIGGGVGGFVQGLLELAVRGRIKTNPDGSQDVDLLSAPEEKPLLPTPEGGPTAPATDEEAKSAELRALIASTEGTTPEVDAAATAAAVAAPEVDVGVASLKESEQQIVEDIRAENAEKKAAEKAKKDAAKEGVPAAAAVAPEAAPVEEPAQTEADRIQTIAEGGPEAGTLEAIAQDQEIDEEIADAKNKNDGERYKALFEEEAQVAYTVELPDDQKAQAKKDWDKVKTVKQVDNWFKKHDAQPEPEAAPETEAAPVEEDAPDLKITPPEQFSDEAIRASQATDDPITFGGQDVTPAAAPETEAELKPVTLTKTKAAKAGDMRAGISPETAEFVVKDQPNIAVRKRGMDWEAVDTNNNNKVIGKSTDKNVLRKNLPKILATPAPEAAPAAAQETTTTPERVRTVDVTGARRRDVDLETPAEPVKIGDKQTPIRAALKRAAERGKPVSVITPLQAKDLEEQKRTEGLTDEELEAQEFAEGDIREAAKLQEEFDDVVAPKRTVAKKTAAKKAAAKKKTTIKKLTTKEKEEIKKEVRSRTKKDADRAVAAVPAKTRAESEQLEFYTKKFGGEQKVSFVNAEGDPVTQSLDIETTKEDDTKILELLKTQIPAQQSKKKQTETSERAEARAAQLYFRKQENPNDALDVITHEATFSPKQFRASKDLSDGEIAYFSGTGPDVAKMALRWVRKNLSDSTNKQVTNLLGFQAESIRASRRRENSQKAVKNDPVTIERKQQADRDLENALAAQQNLIDQGATFKDDELFATQEDIDKYLPDYLMSNAVVNLDIPTHPVVGNLLRQGRLSDALRAIALTTPNPRMEQIATALSRLTGDTKVKVNKFVTNPAGESAAGYFDPKTNTIVLNAETGINPHTILHEMTHAATSAVIANKSHPLTKQLNTLFNNVKDSLDTAYGSQNLDEFVAETFGNPEFQQKLAGINVKGEPISALRRFFNAVANFFRRKMGMQTKPVGSALNEADKLIEAILAPSPQTRDADILYNIQDNLFGHIKGLHQGFKSPTDGKAKDGFVEKVIDFLNGGAATGAKRAAMWALPLQAITDLAKKYKLQDIGRSIQETIEEQIGETNKADVKVDATLKSFETWQKNNPSLTGTFNSIVYESTTEGVDPSDELKTDSKGQFLEGADGNIERDTNKIAVWKNMQDRWNALDTGRGSGKAEYIKMRNAYQIIYKDMKAAVESRIDDLIDSATGDVNTKDADKKKYKKSLMEQIFDKEGIRPYFPLTRKGDKWLQYKAYNAKTNSTETVYEAFESVTARSRRIEQLNQDPNVSNQVDKEGNPITDENGVPLKDIIPYSNSKNISFKNPTPGSFVEQTLEVLNKSKPDPSKGATKAEIDAHNEQVQEIMEMFIKTLPETSFARSMQKRGGRDQKGELGFDEDAFEAFRSRAYDLSRQVQRLKYGNELRKLEQKLESEWKAGRSKGVDPEESVYVKDELIARSRFARNPPDNLLNRAAAQANRVAFLGTIGFNVSSAVVNASQIPLVMFPMLNGRYRRQLGMGAAGTALGKAMGLIGSSGVNRKISEIDSNEDNVNVKGTPSIDNYYETIDGELVVRKDLNLTNKKRAELERLTPLVKMAGDRGLLNRSLFYDTLGIDKTGRKRGAWEPVNAYGALVFHLQESFNRQTALISAFDLEMQQRQANGENINEKSVQVEAAKEALRIAQEVNGGAALATTGRLAQQGLGRVAMMYKGYGIQMYYTLFKTGDAAIRSMKKSKKYTPEEIRAAREQFFGVALASALLAGVQGMPLVGGALLMANLFLDDDEDDAETLLRKHIGEFAYKGPVTAILGTDISSRIGLSNLLYRDNPYNAGASVPERVFEIAGGPAWSVISSYGRGIKDIVSEDGDVERGIEAMLPAAFRNIYKGLPGYGRYARDEGILTRRGDPIVDDVTTGGLIAQMIGFPPTEYTLAQEQNQALKRIDRTVNTRRTKLLKRYYVALRFGDDISDVLEDINKFNGRHPTAAIVPSSIRRSLAGHMRTTLKMHNGITLSPNMRMALRNHADEYSQFGIFDD